MGRTEKSHILFKKGDKTECLPENTNKKLGFYEDHFLDSIGERREGVASYRIRDEKSLQYIFLMFFFMLVLNKFPREIRVKNSTYFKKQHFEIIFHGKSGLY